MDKLKHMSFFVKPDSIMPIGPRRENAKMGGMHIMEKTAEQTGARFFGHPPILCLYWVPIPPRDGAEEDRRGRLTAFLSRAGSVSVAEPGASATGGLKPRSNVRHLS